MKVQRTEQQSFRLKPAVAAKLQKAKDLGLSATQLVNEILEEHLQDHLEAKAQQLKVALLEA